MKVEVAVLGFLVPNKLCVCVCVCARVRARVRACVRACVRARLCMSVWVYLLEPAAREACTLGRLGIIMIHGQHFKTFSTPV